ncbi:hypothetical protein [Pararhizobium mangrovi]|uniref:Inovirus Gp2 family protein n=1 Tax=Pararhizobium mangrovi TaxID=2590452 RepID=A0A506TYJ8_9HYPH|nr:hypothetical protein [Pararhizobium mangrovi]TPW26396.1 hypothetical protein FJU11_15075 [Pararhizobium mangrovi]
MSLDLGIGREGTALDHADPCRLLSNAIGKEMRRTFGHVLPFAIGFEVAPGDGKLHLHGTVILDNASLAHRKAVARVFRRAAGEKPKASRARQCSLKSMDRPEGWAIYSSKSIKRTRQLLASDKLTFVNRDLLRLTRDAWDDL